jgi:hypothetical protein
MTDRGGRFRVPDGANLGDDWEQLQDVLMWTHNRRVIREFRDLSPEDADWTVNLTSARGRLRWASTIKENDSALIVALRMWLFYVILGQAAAFQTPVYGIPVPGYQESRLFQPQIELFFLEDLQDVEQGYSPVSGSIRFRVMNRESDTMTEGDVNSLALKVRTNFANGPGFVWRKGKIMASYTDRRRGYKLQLLVRTESEARRVVEQVLDIQGHVPDWEYLNISQNENEAARYPIIPPTVRILNRTRRGPRRRPIADVRFTAAMLHIHGLPNPIVLVDRSGRHRNPIVTV